MIFFFFALESFTNIAVNPSSVFLTQDRDHRNVPMLCWLGAPNTGFYKASRWRWRRRRSGHCTICFDFQPKRKEKHCGVLTVLVCSEHRMLTNPFKALPCQSLPWETCSRRVWSKWREWHSGLSPAGRPNTWSPGTPHSHNPVRTHRPFTHTGVKDGSTTYWLHLLMCRRAKRFQKKKRLDGVITIIIVHYIYTRTTVQNFCPDFF